MRNEQGFLARGGCAVLILAICIIGYTIDCVRAWLGGPPVSRSAHQTFWGLIIVSGVLTAGSLVAKRLERAEEERERKKWLAEYYKDKDKQ